MPCQPLLGYAFLCLFFYKTVNIEGIFVFSILAGYFISYFISRISYKIIIITTTSMELSNLEKKYAAQARKYNYSEFDSCLQKEEQDYIMLLTAYMEFYLQHSLLFFLYAGSNLLAISYNLATMLIFTNKSGCVQLVQNFIDVCLQSQTPIISDAHINTILAFALSVLFLHASKKTYFGLYKYLFITLYPALAEKHSCKHKIALF